MIPKKLIEEIKNWIKERKYGNVQINFVSGKIMSWNTFQSHKDDVVSTTANESNTNLGS
jgi:hypothetical protein